MTARDTTSKWMHALTDRLARLESPLARYLADPALVLLTLSTFFGVGGGNTPLFLLASALSLLIFGVFGQILVDKRLPFLVGILGGIATVANQSIRKRSTPSRESANQNHADHTEFRPYESLEPEAGS